MKLWAVALVTISCVLFPTMAAPEADPALYGPGKAFPFTADDDRDGAMYVWFIICDSGFRYDYIPAKQFPNGRRFRQVDDPRSGDVAWWPTYVALYDAKANKYITAVGTFRLEELKPGFPVPKYYRLQLFDGEKFAEKGEPGSRTAMCMPAR